MQQTFSIPSLALVLSPLLALPTHRYFLPPGVSFPDGSPSPALLKQLLLHPELLFFVGISLLLTPEHTAGMTTLTSI
jgi:hypothetical protein